MDDMTQARKWADQARHNDGKPTARERDMSQGEFYGLIRSQIEHEDELVNMRVIWLIISQAFFFGAYASLMTAPTEARNHLFEAELSLLVWLLPVAALAAGMLTYVSILSSLRAIANLRTHYDHYAAVQWSTDTSRVQYPDIQGSPGLRRWALVSPATLPLVFSISWFVILANLILSSP